MRIFVLRAITSLLTSRGLRDLRRRLHALRRKMRGDTPTVHYFHQPDDPYSHIAAQSLAALAARYRVKLIPWLAPPPDDAAAPEREMLRLYALRDAPRLAAEYGFDFPANARYSDASAVLAFARVLADSIMKGTFAEIAPLAGRALWAGDADAVAALARTRGETTSAEAERAIRSGGERRKRLGHYLGAMFYFEGEWYWGIDRLNHLEERLQDIGLDTAPAGTPAIAPYRDVALGEPPVRRGGRPVIEYWFSFRSPYSWISFPRMRKLAKHYDCELKLRFILPMVMRGLPVPGVKRLYITLDTKREAERAGLPFGKIVDPVGPGAARALAVLHHAVTLGRGEEFAELGLRAAFADGIELASDKGLNDVAKRAGLGADVVKSALADESWRAIAEENREALFAAGLWGAPSFRVDGKPAHWGQDRFWALEQDIVRSLEGRNA